MEHFKIIVTEDGYPNVLIARDRDKEGCEIVRIIAVGVINGDENMFGEEIIHFEVPESAIDYVRDYSKESAHKWCDRNDIEYWPIKSK